MGRVVDNYPKFIEYYQSIFEPIFRDAKEVSEFNLVLSLIAVRGVSDAGWDPYENTRDVFEEVYKQQKKFKRFLQTNINLWLYVHLLECSEHYELLANLINSITDKDFNVANHKNKNYVNLTVEQKIARLKKISKATKYKNVAEPFEDAFNSRFRNAIAHGDFAIKKSGDTGITVIDDVGYPKIFDGQEMNDLINKALALHVVIRSLSDHFIGQYQESSVIKSSPGFGGGKPIDATLIVRKNHGVIGIRCIGGYDNGEPFETRLVKCLPYELKLIESGMNDLPSSRIDKVNLILGLLPSRLAQKANPLLSRLMKVE